MPVAAGGGGTQLAGLHLIIGVTQPYFSR